MTAEASSPFDALARSNVNSAWAALALEVLAHLGLERVVLSPGSRSTPLTVAAARNPKLEAIPILDERSAAFFALGLAKRTRRPVALVCTSGTAAANWYPAVIEASLSGTPLLLLSADRPVELRACGSGQTIDQTRLFGPYVREFFEVALPELDPGALRYLRQTLVHAVHRSLSGNPGPVHLNFPFRDPLAPEPEAAAVVSRELLEASASVLTRPVESVGDGGGLDAVAVERLGSHRRGLIVVGTVEPREGDEAFADAVALISRKLGWPVLADVLNPLRAHAGEQGALVCRYERILRDRRGDPELAPTAILQIGTLPTSKVLRSWLGQLDAASFLLGGRPVNTDPLHRLAVPLAGEAHVLAELLPHQKADARWRDVWTEAESAAAKGVDGAMEPLDALFEGKAAWLLSRHLPIGSPVFLANSMSVRYAEAFWCPGSRAYSIHCNRGANGIDGTLGTALGVAWGDRPSVLLTGDLAFLHDSNALLGAGRFQGSLTVVLVQNNGGGIFEFLPISGMEPPFEDLFATPQSVDLAGLCAAHGVEHRLVESWDHFKSLIERLPSKGLRVLEVRTDRKADRRRYRDDF